MPKMVLPLLLAVQSFAQPVAFEQQVRPILEARCLQCHNATMAMSNFNISTAATLLKGGKQGSPVVVGKPGESLLYQLAAAGKMPQGGPKLTSAELAILRLWIEQGAPFPPSITLAKQAQPQWWAFRSPIKPAIPASSGKVNPIDAFIADKLKTYNLELSPRAAHATLIRRLHFDLTGLPPSPNALTATYGQTVDELLASPNYGERWARHWLDVVRYGETDGGEHNRERLYAWPYRDYVIGAFNSDKPYINFIREQIAGDVLHPGNPQMLAATGFLVAGPWDQVSAELNKDKLLTMAQRMDELDDMVTTTFHTFQALTVNCARCHDHKFDPIPTKDYYRLTAVFGGVGFGTQTIATAEERKAWDEKTKSIRAALSLVEKQLSDLDAPIRSRILLVKYRAADSARANNSQRITINPIWNRNEFPATTAQHFRFVVLNEKGKLPRVDSLRLLPNGPSIENWRGEKAASPDAPIFLDLPAATSSSIEWSSDAAKGAADGGITTYRLEASDDGVTWRTLCSSLDHVGQNEMDLPVAEDPEIIAQLDAVQQAQRAGWLKQIQELKKQLAAIPEPAKLYSAIHKPMAKSFLLERGQVSRPTEELTPGALSAISQLSKDLALQTEASDAQRRIALANWIANPSNPLTARVIVNRVWYHHFGNGLVNTPSDFGVNGDRPSHPELLDWLATSFMENGWSLKWLHRQIVSSETYQQSSQANPKAFAIDAANRLLWHMPLKRMDAETLRDSLLAASNTLNWERGGPGYMLQKQGSRGSYIYKAVPENDPAQMRRAVYRFVVRGGERIMLDSFDCPDPAVATPQRSISNTPVQALTLLNNAFVIAQAEHLAKRLSGEAATRDGQVVRAYQLLFSRQPSANELTLARQFMATQPLEMYCRVLINSNEFIYVP